MATTTRTRDGAKARVQPGRTPWRPASFFRDAIEELRKVVWPTAPELYRYTIVVVVTVAVIAGFIGAVDAGVGEVVRRFVYSALTK